MDGRGCWRDKVFIKYEEVYLHAYASVNEARQGIARYFESYNRIRPHSTLGGQTPDEVYCYQTPLTRAA